MTIEQAEPDHAAHQTGYFTIFHLLGLIFAVMIAFLLARDEWVAHGFLGMLGGLVVGVLFAPIAFALFFALSFIGLGLLAFIACDEIPVGIGLARLRTVLRGAVFVGSIAWIARSIPGLMRTTALKEFYDAALVGLVVPLGSILLLFMRGSNVLRRPAIKSDPDARRLRNLRRPRNNRPRRRPVVELPTFQPIRYTESPRETTLFVSAACCALMAISVMRHASCRLRGGGPSPRRDRANWVNMSICGVRASARGGSFSVMSVTFFSTNAVSITPRVPAMRRLVRVRGRCGGPQIVECHGRQTAVPHGEDKRRLAAARRESQGGPSFPLGPAHR